MKRSLTLVAAAAAATLALAGCSSDSGDAGGSDDGITIGIALPAGNQLFWTGWMNGAKATADELGVSVTFTDAKNDAQTMNDQVNTLIVKGVDGIAIASVDPTANASVVQAATDAGIPLITSNRLLDTTYGGIGGANPILHTGFNDILNGENEAELVKQACGEGECKVVLEQGTLGSTPEVQRTTGLENGLEDSPNIEIVERQSNDFDPTKAIDLTQTLLQSHPDMNVLAVQTDPEALAAAKVLQEQGVADKIKIVSIGGSADGVKAVEDGSIFGTVLVSANEDGGTSVQTLVDIINGTDIEVDDSGDQPTVVVPSVIVTKENAADNPGDW